MNNKFRLGGKYTAEVQKAVDDRLNAAFSLNQEYIDANPEAVQKHQRELETIAEARRQAARPEPVVRFAVDAAALAVTIEVPSLPDPGFHVQRIETSTLPYEPSVLRNELDPRQEAWLDYWWSQLKTFVADGDTCRRNLAVLIQRSGGIFGQGVPPIDQIASRVNEQPDRLHEAWDTVARETKLRGEGISPLFALTIQIQKRAPSEGIKAKRQRFKAEELAMVLKAIVSKLKLDSAERVRLSHQYFLSKSFAKSYHCKTGRKLSNRDKLRSILNLLQDYGFVERENHLTRPRGDDDRFKSTVYRLGVNPPRLPWEDCLEDRQPVGCSNLSVNNENHLDVFQGAEGG